jgi:hypothetical protein
LFCEYFHQNEHINKPDSLAFAHTTPGTFSRVSLHDKKQDKEDSLIQLTRTWTKPAQMLLQKKEKK